MPKTDRIPKYRYHKATGQALVVLDGKTIYLGPHGTAESRANYDRMVAEWLANHRTLVRPDEPLTVAELLLKYWRFAQGYYVKGSKQTSEVAKIKDAIRTVRRVYGRTSVGEFGPLKLKAVREQKINQKLARSTINSRIEAIKRLFKWGVAEELVPPSVFQGLQAVTGLRRGRSEARETAPVKPVSEHQIDAGLPHVSAEIAAMIKVQLLTGMRPGEVVLIRGGDIDLSRDPWIYRPASHKLEQHDLDRMIHIGPQCQEVLRPFLRPGPHEYLLQPKQAEQRRNTMKRESRKSAGRRRPRKLIRQRPPGEHYDVAAYRRAISRACEKARTA